MEFFVGYIVTLNKIRVLSLRKKRKKINIEVGVVGNEQLLLKDLLIFVVILNIF